MINPISETSSYFTFLALPSEIDHVAADRSHSISIRYGKRYHIVNDKRDFLAHDWTHWRFLQMGPRAHTGVFKICASMNHCTLNQPNEVVQAGDKFLIFDEQGNYWNHREAFLTGFPYAPVSPAQPKMSALIRDTAP
ncbi:hypothetical protein N7519_009155 [Penicillium mononematosum]|uniref:uncharacterized protein n=1 Tax=Penicillium mononematosum TaxID=268346 RepID=UPI002547D097|nr:uncharacterized protein N7519_009155 [Penicillium mononematosum]KAJ6178694.1 hypothetical protein N7519_009155 [Penicillium mononematosum]